MSEPHRRKLKQIQFAVDSTAFECQIEAWTMQNNTEDGERRWAQCPEGEFREEPDPDYALEVTGFSDWRSGGLSDFLTEHNGELLSFQLDHLYDVPGEHVRWTGELYARAPGAGGESRSTEMTEVTLPIKGEPVYSRP